MPSAPKNPQAEFAKLLAAACVRRGYLEKLHAGATPVTWMGDFSDVKVVDADGREIPWSEVSRIKSEKWLPIELSRLFCLIIPPNTVHVRAAVGGKKVASRPVLTVSRLVNN
jgi:hypothetical protein